MEVHARLRKEHMARQGVLKRHARLGLAGREGEGTRSYEAMKSRLSLNFILKGFCRSTLRVSSWFKTLQQLPPLAMEKLKSYRGFEALSDPLPPICHLSDLLIYSPPCSLLQLHWAPCCSLTMLGMPPPQDLCTCYCFCLKCPFPDIHMYT